MQRPDVNFCPRIRLHFSTNTLGSPRTFPARDSHVRCKRCHWVDMLDNVVSKWVDCKMAVCFSNFCICWCLNYASHSLSVTTSVRCQHLFWHKNYSHHHTMSPNLTVRNGSFWLWTSYCHFLQRRFYRDQRYPHVNCKQDDKINENHLINQLLFSYIL